jgi:hypothetical protein
MPRYRNQHIESGKGSLSTQGGATAEVFYVLWTAEASPGDSGQLFSPVTLEIQVREIQFLKDATFADDHVGETLTLRLQDGRLIELCSQPGWIVRSDFRHEREEPC